MWKMFAALACPLFLTLGTAGEGWSQVPSRPDTAVVEPEGPPFSPRGAFLRSLVLPGWGQAYVGSPQRGAVYFTLAGGSSLMAYVARRQLRDARAEQQWLRDTGRIAPDAETDLALARGRQVEDWLALSIFLYFLAGADAYVAAYLADFDERFGVRPGTERSLQVEARIPLPR